MADFGVLVFNSALLGLCRGINPFESGKPGGSRQEEDPKSVNSPSL
jgi:hypothetical protein